VINSWSELPEKIKYGNTYDFGNFDQCLQVRKNVNQNEIIGQHCLFQFYSKSNGTISRHQSNNPLNPRWNHMDERFGGAICLPASCKPETVKKILFFLLERSDYKVAEDYEQADYCKTKKTSETLSKSMIATFNVTGFLLVCVISSTIYDLSTKNVRNAKQNEWFLAFSLNKNLSDLLQTKNESTNEVKSLNFIRSFVAFCVFLGHTTIILLLFPNDLPIDFVTNGMKIFLGAVVIIVIVFFVIGGFLVTRIVINSTKMYDFVSDVSVIINFCLFQRKVQLFAVLF
jgi:hypothetical protein